ncbi:glycosyltransferase [Methanobacterium aggregans]|uniref:glycosyltransferase n=1 Tax=Methanobacterium aggregans TaxID=1615586 RepID=UPI001AE78146|nr:glycosyltransferase [Methanobacterium aggregans]MBP2046662.1 glycosyltransferase involved in cell wall biosynthesis [Methanobacterium aggregans]
MNRFWNILMQPIIEKVNANYIVEIGSDTGINTRNILDYCVEHDAHMTAIDPVPKFDINEFKAEYGDRFEIYKELSLNRLPLLEDYDVILIDGDHNWYTVYNELKIIEKNFKDKKFPIIFLHDVGWPYGRRDLYYNPKNIPEKYRQPYERLGMYPGQTDLKKEGGLNAGLYNSIYENTPQNGVLTAVEDFLRESHKDFIFEYVDAFFGLGILAPKTPELVTTIKNLLNSANLLHILEKEMVKVTIANSETRSLKNKLNNTLNETNINLGETQNQLHQKEEELKKKDFLIRALKKKEKSFDYLNGQVEDLTARFYELEYLSNKNRPFTQKLISKFPQLYILFNRKNNGLKNTYINLKGFNAIKNNHLIDIGYYLKNNKDIRVSGVDPILHYIYHGYQEGRNPNPQFNSKYYTEKYSDVKKSKLNPLIHYSLYGKKEGRQKKSLSQVSISKNEVVKNIDEVQKIKRQVRETPEKLNIAYVLWDFPALSQTFVMNELRWLVENNYNVRVFYKVKPDKEAKVNFNIEAIPIEDASDLIQKINEFDINLMHTHFVYPACTLLTYPAAEATGIPFTVSAHAIDIFHHLNDERNKIGEIGQSSLCLRIFVPGKFHFEYLSERGVPQHKIMFLRQATRYKIEEVDFNTPRVKRDIKNVITVARFIEKKGIDTFIEAAKILENEEMTFKIYGYGPLEENLKSKVKELDLKNVIFEGPIKGDIALKEVYQEGDLFVLPSRRASNGDMDGMPTVIFEAMAYGIPVITTNVSSIPEFVLNGYSGFVINPDEPSDLADKIVYVRDMDKNDLTVMLKRAQQEVQRISNVEETIETMVNIWSNNKIDIFMVTYQTGHYKDLKTMKEILDQIFKHTTLEFNLTIIDNNSDEDFKNFLVNYSRLYTNISLIFLKDNLQCGPASNIALEKMKNEFAIYICSNEGFIIKHGWEREAINYMKKHPNVGIAGNLIHSPSFYNGRTYKGQKWFKKFRNKDYILNKDNVKFKHIQGGIYILRRGAYEDCGGFNPLLPQDHMDVEYSYYLESQGWELGEISEWVSLSKKTRPGIFTYLDENTTFVHPLKLEENKQIEHVALKNCNICNGELNGRICSSCDSDSSERAIYRIIGNTDWTHRSLKCTLLLNHNSIYKSVQEPFFELVNQQYSTRDINESLEDLIENLKEQSDIIITNMDLNVELLNRIITTLKAKLLIIQLSNNELLNKKIKKFLTNKNFSIEIVEFMSEKLINKKFLVVECNSHV